MPWLELAEGRYGCGRGEGKKKEVAAGSRAVRGGGGGARATAAVSKPGRVRRQWGRRRQRWGRRRLPQAAWRWVGEEDGVGKKKNSRR